MAHTYVDDRGYRRFADSDKLVSRWVAEKRFGRELGDEEVVHHINRDKGDNSWGNLYVFKDQDAHDEVHEE